MSQTQVEGLLALQELRSRAARRAMLEFSPYPAQIKAVMDKARLIVLFGGNQSGKSHTAAHRVAYDALGIYPDWWKGNRTRKGIDVWVVGEKFTTTRDSCQKKLFGANIDRPGDGGLIAPDYIIGKPSRMSGVTGMIDTIKVKHVSGQTSTITFKSYEQGREALASWTGDLIWIDEEPPMDCFQELQMRVIARQGVIIVTFTPLKGFTKLYKLFTNPNSEIPCFWLDWDQAKHLNEDTKNAIAKMYSSNPAELKARMTGRAAIATGLVYPFDLEDISCPDFRIDGHFRQLGSLDPGWKHPTACVAIAHDPDADVYYIHKNHRQSEWTIDRHVAVLNSWGDIDFACDTAALQGDKASGEKIMDTYADAMDPGWKQKAANERRFFHASKGVSFGIDIVYRLFQEQRLFIFKSCRETLEELSAYHYDDNGKIYKVDDDLMDSMRYALTHPQRFRVPGRCRPSARSVEIPQWKPRHPNRSF